MIDDIELKPAMIAAGVKVVWENLGGADLGGFFNAEEFVSEIYVAMLNAQEKD